ncbi:VOC family protein [uncultured Maritalea sp.]|uniref:VOC family protein n=1 Tax=uncultured Maritalea sp. TaxID=757249 RepID=UPI00261E16ED|nr:VOC family protein [uncultured Maritalea sp.]
MANSVSRLFYTILAKDVTATAAFYCSILELKRHFDSDWFVILTPESGPLIELAILDEANPIVPKEMAKRATGGILTFVVQDVHQSHTAAMQLGANVVSVPTAMPYGQERMLVEDPNGQLIDISSPTVPVQN